MLSEQAFAWGGWLGGGGGSRGHRADAWGGRPMGPAWSWGLATRPLCKEFAGLARPAMQIMFGNFSPLGKRKSLRKESKSLGDRLCGGLLPTPQTSAYWRHYWTACHLSPESAGVPCFAAACSEDLWTSELWPGRQLAGSGQSRGHLQLCPGQAAAGHQPN